MKEIFTALLIFISSTIAEAALLTTDTKAVNLLQSALFLEDPTGQLNLEDIKKRDGEFRPWLAGGTEANFGFTSSAYWVRISLQRVNGTNPDWLLEINYPKIFDLEFYPPEGQGIFTGSSKALSTRPYFDRFFTFPINVSTEPSDYYIRATSYYALTLPISAWQPDHYRHEQQKFQLLQFSYYGGFIVLTLYSLIIFLTNSDRRFLIYSAFIVTTGLGVFSGNGYGRQLLWPNAPFFDEISQNTFLGLAAFFTVSLSRSLFILPNKAVFISKGLWLSQYAFLIIFGLTLMSLLISELTRPVNVFLMINALIMGFLVSAACLLVYRQRQEGIRFFLMGWMILWLGITTASLRAFGLIPSNALTAYAVQIASAFEVLLMALALGDLLKIENKAKILAREVALEANQSLLKLTRASEENLRLAVHQRTAQLERSLEKETALREQYVRFGSLISHEFRTPLSIIQSQASLLRKEHQNGIDHVTKRIEAINSATKRITVMFDKWLNSDGITSTMESIQLKKIELGPWLKTVISTSTHLWMNHRIQLQLSPQVTEVVADEYHLGLALTNLIDNAAKYSAPSSVIKIEVREKMGYVGIAVIDEGFGIPDELKRKVFSDFFRISPESHIRGVGLGLSIVKRIADAHGGDVELTSQIGVGSNFCIWLRTEQKKE